MMTEDEAVAKAAKILDATRRGKRIALMRTYRSAGAVLDRLCPDYSTDPAHWKRWHRLATDTQRLADEIAARREARKPKRKPVEVAERLCHSCGRAHSDERSNYCLPCVTQGKGYDIGPDERAEIVRLLRDEGRSVNYVKRALRRGYYTIRNIAEAEGLWKPKKTG